MVEVSRSLKQWLVNGLVLTVPLVVTLLVLLVVIDFVLGILSPIVEGIAYIWPNQPHDAVIQFMTIVSLFVFFLLVGFVAEHTPGRHLSKRVHTAMETIPGVSTIYESVRRASNLLVDDETEQFKDVKLVEFPHQGSYMFAFLTADTPERIERCVSKEPMVTVMLPLGPNPTTNGFIMHIPAENVYDVDITVEEAVRSIATLGVSVDELAETGATEGAENDRHATTDTER
jgi:uncharacterized membrane protein